MNIRSLARFCVLVTVVVGGSVVAQGTDRLSLGGWYGTAQYFQWKEDVFGLEIKEDGMLYGIGGQIIEQPIEKGGVAFRLQIEGCLGVVDYDGYNQPAMTPATGNTVYQILKTEGDVGYAFPIAAKTSLAPLAGVGFRFSRRGIGADADWGDVLDFSWNSDPIEVQYIEDWWSFYGILGGRVVSKIGADAVLFANIYAKYPFENTEKMDTFFGDYKVHPGKEWSGCLEVGVKTGNLFVALGYEALRFSQSDVDSDAVAAVFQPESSADIVSLKVGVSY